MHTYYRYVSDFLQPLINTLAHPSCQTAEFQTVATETGRLLLKKVDSAGVNIVLGDLVVALRKDDPRVREAGCRLLRCFFEESDISIKGVVDMVLPVVRVMLDENLKLCPQFGQNVVFSVCGKLGKGRG